MRAVRAISLPISRTWSLSVEEHSYLWLALGVVVTAGARVKSQVVIFLLLNGHDNISVYL